MAYHDGTLHNEDAMTSTDMPSSFNALLAAKHVYITIFQSSTTSARAEVNSTNLTKIASWYNDDDREEICTLFYHEEHWPCLGNEHALSRVSDDSNFGSLYRPVSHDRFTCISLG